MLHYGVCRVSSSPHKLSPPLHIGKEGLATITSGLTTAKASPIAHAGATLKRSSHTHSLKALTSLDDDLCIHMVVGVNDMLGILLYA